MNLPRLQRRIALVGKEGNPTQEFQIWWQRFAEQIESQLAAINGNTADIAANTADLAAAAVSLSSLDARIDAYDALSPFVRADQAAAPAYTAYAGQTVSNPPTQAQVQALDDAVKALSAVVVTLIARLQTVDVLT